MPLAKAILSQFRVQIALKNPSRAEFHGPYNKIIYSLFPADTDFTIFPHFLPEVQIDDRPVFLLELKRPGDLQCSLKCREADQQIQERMKVLRGECPLKHACSSNCQCVYAS
ncbi:hypothetical protein EDB84DRAFT_1490325 [Lactarius hengduanensis]|nr:hypothetical protein EDB84DRAFT_1490325 [Lactarius hengduanensis]